MGLLNPNWFRKEKKGLTENGREVPDPKPMAPPVGFRAAPSLADQIREMVRSEKLAQDLKNSGVETFEEADDFDVDDDFDPNTPFEEQFDPEGRSSFTPIAEVNKQEKAANEKRKAERAPSTPQPSSGASQTTAESPAANPPKEPAKPAGDQKPSA